MPFLLSNFTFLFLKSASGFLERLEPLFNCLATKQRCLAALQRCLQVLLTYLEAKQRYIAAKHTCFVTKQRCLMILQRFRITKHTCSGLFCSTPRAGTVQLLG
jgi:hypothetical protein